VRIQAHDEPTRAAIARCIEKLPSEVQAFVDQSVEFVGGVNGLAIPPRNPRWVVVLPGGADASVVCHEIGHAYSNHRGLRPAFEAEAASLARAWGANGHGADAEECSRAEVLSPGFNGVVEDGWLSFACGSCQSHAIRVVSIPGAPRYVALFCVRCVRGGVERLVYLAGLKCPACGVDAATSLVRDSLPPITWRDPWRWARLRCPGLARWASLGFPLPFKITLQNGEARIRCGTCRRHSRLKVATK